jgi:glutamate synthase domain-containing protein 3
MSGGIAYIYDAGTKFREKCNLGMVELERVSADDVKIIYKLLHNHYRYTQSPLAAKIIDNLPHDIRKFIKVMPIEYKRILEMKEAGELKDTEVSDG